MKIITLFNKYLVFKKGFIRVVSLDGLYKIVAAIPLNSVTWMFQQGGVYYGQGYSYQKR